MGHRIDDLGRVNDPNRLIGILPARHVGSPEHNSSSWSWAKFHGRMDETHPKTIQESPENCRPCLAKVPRSSLWPFWIQQTALQLCHASRTSDLRAGHRTCFTIKNDFKSTLGCIVIICSWPGLGYLRSSYMYMLHGTTQEPTGAARATARATGSGACGLVTSNRAWAGEGGLGKRWPIGTPNIAVSVWTCW